MPTLKHGSTVLAMSAYSCRPNADGYGHAFVNVQTYDVFDAAAQMVGYTGSAERVEHYRKRADCLKSARGSALYLDSCPSTVNLRLEWQSDPRSRETPSPFYGLSVEFTPRRDNMRIMSKIIRGLEALPASVCSVNPRSVLDMLAGLGVIGVGHVVGPDGWNLLVPQTDVEFRAGLDREFPAPRPPAAEPVALDPELSGARG